MRLKTFQAKTMTEAMRQIKDTLGDDAIIVSTREDPNGWIRVTAAVEHIAEKPAPAAQKPGYDEETILEMITDTLLKHRVPAAVSDKIISFAMTVNSNHPQKTLAIALEKTFTFPPAGGASKPLMLVGPPGAGKTLMTAKLAAEAVMDGRKAAVITTDIARAGGVEQLTAFLDILGVKLQQAEDAVSLKTELAACKGADFIIIDTGGLNPFDPQEMKFLAKLMQVADAETALVLPAGIDAEESAEMAMTFEILGVRRIIPTRLDFARRLGGILSAADKAGLGLGTASHTPQVANGILYLTPEKLAELLMPHVPEQPPAGKGKKS